MQVKSVSQLSSVIESGSFNDEFEKMKSSQTYIEVSIRRKDAEFDSFKCNFTDFLAWIEAKFAEAAKGLNDKIDELSATIDANFVHKTISGEYKWYGENPEIVQGRKWFADQLSGTDGDFISLSGYNLTATSLTATDIKDTNLTAVNITDTNLSASTIKTAGLTATTFPADLSAKCALWT